MRRTNQASQARPAGPPPPRRRRGLPLEIPDYELIRPIGKGSYGEVWLVKNVLGGYRAAKFIERAAFSDSRPFEREFEGIKKFEPISRTHPGFVSILHAGRNEARGYFFYIMELADDIASGQVVHPDNYTPRTLASDLANQARLSLAECAQLGLSLSEALQRLHRHGLIHRDIKPSNIVFVGGTPKLADIGLVTDSSDGGTSLGTTGYFPPGESASLIADIYALGMVLYEASSGKSPAQFPELPTALAGAEETNQFARFNEVILQACALDAHRRFHSAEALRAALGRCVGHEDEATTHSHHEPSAARGAGRAGKGERKLLTTVVIIFTARGQVDPEAWQSFMDACMDRIRPVVLRYEGTLAQRLGDGALCSFGAAMAVEDRARRAALAALEIKSLFKGSIETDFDFAVRIGLNSGLAIAARAGAGVLPAGDTVNLASRLAALAEPDQIVTTEETWRAIKDYFIVRPLGEKQALGSAAGLQIYQILEARELRTRIEVESEKGLTPFVGRKGELALLQQKLGQARAGHGQIVLLAGEPGMGKSRLLLEFQRSLGGKETSWLAGRSISFGSQMAWLPIIDLLRHSFQIKDADDQATVACRIETEERNLGPGLESAWPFLKYLLSPHSDDDPVAGMNARERRVRTFESLRNLLLTKSAKTPVILVIEDLHWADKTTEEFLVLLADAMSMAPLLMLLTYRPGYRNPFPEQSFISRVTLQPLTDEESRSVAERVLREKALPAAVQELVIGKADGNPFFVEEMIRCLDEAGALRADPDAPEGGAAFRAQVPETIQDVIMSRIDRLEESPRTTLQLASVIGREFSVALLETIADLNEPLARSLQKLKSLELIYERSLLPEHTCFFKHALTQEVAYNSLLLQRRKELHCLVAAAIEEMHVARLPESYALLAYHYERGEEWERALDYLRRAAEQFRRIGAYREEVLQLTQAMAVAKRLGRSDVLADLRGLRGTARVKIGMFAEARPDLEMALAALPFENRARRAELALSMAGGFFWDLDTVKTQQYGAEGLALAEEAGREDLVAEALTFLGASQQSFGNLTAARGLFEQARAKGGGFSSAALANYPLTLYLNGRLRDALERSREAAEAFRGSSDAFGASFGHPHLGLALAGCGRYAEAEAVFEEAKQLGAKHEIWHFHARAMGMSAGFHLDAHDLRGYEALALEARECARSAPFRPTEVSATIDLVFHAMRVGRVGQAERFLKEAETLAAQVAGWHEWLWALRLKQARAELAHAREAPRVALDLASEAISESRARGRPKYVAAGLETRAKCLVALGRLPEAAADLRHAADLARSMGDPALLVRMAANLLAIDGNDELLAETRTAARGISDALPNDAMRQSFRCAEMISLLGKF